MIPTYTTFQAVLESTRRVPFNGLDLEMLKAYKSAVAGTPRDVLLHHSLKDEVKEALAEGFIVLQCPRLETDFTFVKIDAGRGLFGGQKHRVSCYVGVFDNNELMPGSTYRNLAIGLSAINNIHRSVGRKLAQAGW